MSAELHRPMLRERCGSLAPHSVFFVFYNFLYFVPLVLLALLRYNIGMDEELGTAYLIRITLIYLAGVCLFLLGSAFALATDLLRDREIVLPRWRPDSVFVVLVVLLVVSFLISKYLLIPLGVYKEYAFDTEQMVGGIWSFSMFASETILFVSLALLFSEHKRNVILFALLTAVNGINLLHGTRIFFIIAMLALALHSYLRGTLTKKKVLLAAPVLLLFSYMVFLVRSNGNFGEGSFSPLHLISPVMYEGVFSQLSLMELVKNTDLWNATGNIPYFFSDITIFTVPRFLAGEKETLQFMSRYSELSPLGAFSGYAQGLIYFGLFFPFFYFVLGFIAGSLLREARKNSVALVFYAYFVCDFLFRIMRDGYSIPIKMFLNAAMLWLIYLAVRFFISPRSVRAAHASAVQ